MTTATRYHISNLGSFAKGIPTDIDGYVYLTAEGWMSANVDGDFSDSATGEYDADYHREWAEEQAAKAVKATEQAESQLAERQSRKCSW